MMMFRVTLKAYGMTRVRYIEAETADEARRRADGGTSIGVVVRVQMVGTIDDPR